MDAICAFQGMICLLDSSLNLASQHSAWCLALGDTQYISDTLTNGLGINI